MLSHLAKCRESDGASGSLGMISEKMGNRLGSELSFLWCNPRTSQDDQWDRIEGFVSYTTMSIHDDPSDLTANYVSFGSQVDGYPADNLTPTTPPQEQWIFAPIEVIIQQMSIKKTSLASQEKPESPLSFFVETMIPFLFAGFGLIFAGLLLEEAETWSFFTDLPDAITLVPTLLGMKGNLEMTLASRLSTLANLGFMEDREHKWNVALSNIALIQTQAIVVSSIAVIPPIVLGEKPFMIRDSVCLLLSAVATASLASLMLGILMIGVVIIAKKWKVNPDNITTPVAASLGDMTTLFILLVLGTLLLRISERHYWIPIVFLIFFYLVAIISAYRAAEDQFTVEVLKHGWWAVLAAMSITTLSGFVLKTSMRAYPPIAAFQPLINGIGGNLVAVQASRISTGLHRERKNKIQDRKNLWIYTSPWHAFITNHADSIAARILVAISIPANFLFVSTIFMFGCGFTNTIPFTLTFMLVSLTQIVILLYFCQLLVRAMWNVRIDPDSSAIPILTATGDLLGSVLLIGCFWLSANLYGMHFTDEHFAERRHQIHLHIESSSHASPVIPLVNE